MQRLGRQGHVRGRHTRVGGGARHRHRHEVGAHHAARRRGVVAEELLDLALLRRGQHVEHGEAALLLDLEQQVGGVVARHSAEDRATSRSERCVEELELMLVVELLEDVRLELLVLSDGSRISSPSSWLAASTRSAICAGCRCARRRGREPQREWARGRRRARAPSHGTNDRRLRSSRRTRRGKRRPQARAEARVDAGDAPERPRCSGARPRRPHQPRGIDVDHAASEHVGAQQHLRGPALELCEVQLRRGQVCGAGLQALDVADRHEQIAAADRGAQSDHGRERVATSRRATTSSTRPRRSLAQSSSGLPASEERWRTPSAIWVAGNRLPSRRAAGQWKRPDAVADARLGGSTCR